MELNDKLKNRRLELGLTLEEVADLVGVSKPTIYRYESGEITNIKLSMVDKLAKALNTTPKYLMGWDGEQKRPKNILPYVPGRRIPIVGAIHAGGPALAVENIEGYDYADVPECEDYFFLRVNGDSMINARICSGDIVLVKSQPSAENGDIVVCLINGDEATLKRFHQQGEMVILQPENAAYQPVIVPCKDFETGYARIIGVAKEVKHRL